MFAVVLVDQDDQLRGVPELHGVIKTIPRRKGDLQVVVSLYQLEVRTSSPSDTHVQDEVYAEMDKRLSQQEQQRRREIKAGRAEHKALRTLIWWMSMLTSRCRRSMGGCFWLMRERILEEADACDAQH